MNKYYTIFELVIENTLVRHEPTYHNGIEVASLVIYTCVKSCSVHLLQFITVHNTKTSFSSSRQHNRTYRSQFMTSTYLHVNCVVGVACAEAFANKNIARRAYTTRNHPHKSVLLSARWPCNK